MKSRAILMAVSLIAGLHSAYSAQPQTGPKHIEITASRFDFTPSEITLKKDDPVVIVLRSDDVAHGLRFRELGIDIKAGKGKTAETQFTPNKVGVFTGHCSVFCGSGHGRMKLILHVIE
jgi:cytochrome c oxidase subunit II